MAADKERQWNKLSAYLSSWRQDRPRLPWRSGCWQLATCRSCASVRTPPTARFPAAARGAQTSPVQQRWLWQCPSSTCPRSTCLSVFTRAWCGDDNRQQSTTLSRLTTKCTGVVRWTSRKKNPCNHKATPPHHPTVRASWITPSTGHLSRRKTGIWEHDVGKHGAQGVFVAYH
jgi:hypothetical protein